MSLGPSLTCSRSRRDELNNFRNVFTFGANIVVLLTAFILFIAVPNTLVDFEIMTYVNIVIGLPCSIFFMVVINENKLTT